MRKPALAGTATNCLSCPAESECIYSAKKIYNERHLKQGKTGWPVKTVVPEIEDILKRDGTVAAEEELMKHLAEDYDSTTTPTAHIDNRPWFGRCVYESDNDVCDDQFVTITWDDDPLPLPPLPNTTPAPNTAASGPPLNARTAKTATFHMVAFTSAICARRGTIYGTLGELSYDSTHINVHDFRTGATKTHVPHQAAGSGHGGGDDGLARQYVDAVNAVKNHGVSAEEAQTRFLGCGIEDVLRSHAMVFAAEESRREGRVVRWGEWWGRNVEERLGGGRDE